MKKIDKILEACKKKAIDNLYVLAIGMNKPIKMKITKQQLSQASFNLMEGFYEAFIKELNKKINFKRCLDKSKTREMELIKEIERIVLVSNINGSDEAIEEIKNRISEYKG
jgi:hypothetical protein